MPYCTHCGQPTNENDRFCARCGAGLGNPAPADPPDDSKSPPPIEWPQPRHRRARGARGARIGIAGLAAIVLGLGAVLAARALIPQRAVQVPDVMRLSHEQASAVLEARGFRVVIDQRVPDYLVPENAVTSQDPQAGRESTRGATVRLTLSTGSVGVALPDLCRLSLEEAKAKLRDMSVQCKVVEAVDPSRSGAVINQSPPAGTNVLPQQVVVLTVASPLAR